MRILTISILSLIFVFFELVMFKISWELGISSLVLICTILCISFVLKKITTIVLDPDFAVNSEPFRNSKKIESNIETASDGSKSGSTNLIPGLDGSIFEKFKNNLNLKNSANNSSEMSSLDENSQNEDFIKKVYENSEALNNQNSFLEELNDKEQVRVTLSNDAKNINKSQTKIISENMSPELDEIADREKHSQTNALGSGEKALKILSSKQEALRKQTERSPIIDLVDYEDDIFEDELIPIPGGETFSEAEKDISKKNNISENSYYLEDEKFLENSISNNQTENEKISEAEALLKLATTACQSGRIEEAKASLEIYLDLLNDLNQEPSKNIKNLAEKLDISIKSPQTNLKKENIDEVKSKTNLNEEPLLQDIPEQANYANVMDGLVKSLEEKEAFEEALPLLMDLIDYNRKRGNISEMDPLYDRLEKAYSSLKNDEKLVSAYKEHLSIKQELNDLEGELHLLDLISYYYANTGDQKASERYQIKSQRVKNLIEQKNPLE